MHLIEDYRKKKKDDEGDEAKHEHPIHIPFDPVSEDITADDSEALELKGRNPLEEEEGQKENDEGND